MTETCIAYTVEGRCDAERVKPPTGRGVAPLITIEVNKRYCMVHGLMMDWRDPLGRHFSLATEKNVQEENYWLR